MSLRSDVQLPWDLNPNNDDHMKLLQQFEDRGKWIARGLSRRYSNDKSSGTRLFFPRRFHAVPFRPAAAYARYREFHVEFSPCELSVR